MARAGGLLFAAAPQLFCGFYIAFEPCGKFHFGVGEGFGDDLHVGIEGFNAVPTRRGVGGCGGGGGLSC